MFALVLLGLIAFPKLPLAPLPQAEFPTIQVTAQLPGASPETMASSVATPLEVQFSAIPGVAQMTSNSALGSSTLTLTFNLNKNIDAAAQEVQAAINTAAGRLPQDLPNLPTWRKVNPADSPVLILGISSVQLSGTSLSDGVETMLARQISQIAGVGQVNVVGQRRPAIRVQAQADKLAALGLTLADLRGIIQASSLNLAKGALYGDSRVSTLSANDQLFQPEGYADLIVAYRDGAPVRMKDVASVVAGAENDYVQAWSEDEPGVNLAPHVALGDAVNLLEQTQRELGMPASISGTFQGAAQAFRSSLASQPWLILSALVAVYIILGVLYESLVHPLTIISTLPSAGLGALGLLWACGQSFSIMALIGLVLLIGIVKKNGILLIDFALSAQRTEGLAPREAIRRACLARLRPILMTTLAALLGAVPLMLGLGAGAELRQPLGIAVIGGLVVSQALTLFTTPIIYLQLEELFHGRKTMQNNRSLHASQTPP
ncbi:efflux RND transporter permease subunit [Pseudomonas sp. DC3200b2]|uniref:efflux RND transporter permease subunit n=1 Tax=Pseudomonas sp. DC3200b2 TaxID=2804669 RepID=UPI003CE8765B